MQPEGVSQTENKQESDNIPSSRFQSQQDILEKISPRERKKERKKEREREKERNREMQVTSPVNLIVRL